MNTRVKIALGGGCHWCTEAVIVYFNPKVIPLKVLVEIHLHTHKSTSNHSRRDKYRSAVYFYTKQQEEQVKVILEKLQDEFEEGIITQVLEFAEFKASREAIQNYYQKNPEKPFCKQFIDPKLKLLLNKFSTHLKTV